MTDPPDHDPDLSDHDRPIPVITIRRSTRSRWAETRNQARAHRESGGQAIVVSSVSRQLRAYGWGLQERALELRNRFAMLIHRRLGAVRAAARFLFRDHPEVVRKVTSGYERAKQAKRRKKKREGKASLDGEKSR